MQQLRIRMTARAVDQPHRAATQLELLFDLTFVVAIAAVVVELAHGLADGHAAESTGPFLLVFFAIWWAWMNFTWFASGCRRAGRSAGPGVPLGVRALRGVRRAALGAGLEFAVLHAGAPDAVGTGYAVAVPTAVYLVLLWVCHSPVVPRSRVRPATLFGAAGLVLLAPVLGAGGGPGVVVGLVAAAAAAAVAVTVVRYRIPS